MMQKKKNKCMQQHSVDDSRMQAEHVSISLIEFT